MQLFVEFLNLDNVDIDKMMENIENFIYDKFDPNKNNYETESERLYNHLLSQVNAHPDKFESFNNDSKSTFSNYKELWGSIDNYKNEIKIICSQIHNMLYNTKWTKSNVKSIIQNYLGRKSKTKLMQNKEHRIYCYIIKIKNEDDNIISIEDST